MLSVKKVLTIRVSGKERKQKVRKLLYDLAHFRNLLIILINHYRFIFKETLINQSVLYGLLAEKGYSGKYRKEFEKVLENVSSNRELKDLLDRLTAQKEKVGNAPLVQSVIRQVLKDFQNYFKALQEYRKNPNKFRGLPRPPMKLPKNFPYRISSARLKLFGDDLYVDLVYECKVEEVKPKGEYRAGIDVGLDELLSVVSENPNLRSFIVSGREIKAFNQWFNKEKAKLQSQIDYLRNELRQEDGYTEKDLKRMQRKLRKLELKSKVLSAYRKRWIDTQFHRIARKVVDILYETGHKVLYIRKNALESKNGINLSKKINQAFVFIPFRRLIELIKYKAQELGMEVIEVDESYTSKTSPFASINEAEKTRDFKGERKGNLFKDKVLNKVFHADLVGALNILRKGAKLLRLGFYQNLKTLFLKLCNPVRLKLMELFFKVIPESLLWEIGDSRQGILSPAGLSLRTEKRSYLNTFCL